MNSHPNPRTAAASPQDWSFYGNARGPLLSGLSWLGFLTLVPALIFFFARGGLFAAAGWSALLTLLALAAASKNRSALLLGLALLYLLSTPLLLIGTGVNP